jgi:hypothetical protein
MNSVALMRSRVVAFGVWVFCVFEAFMSWRSIGKPAPSVHDPIHILGLLAVGAIFLSVAIRSTFSGDRVVFGAAAAAGVLWTIIAVVLPSPATVRVLRTIVLSLWIAAVIAGLSIFVQSGWKRRSTES